MNKIKRLVITLSSLYYILLSISNTFATGKWLLEWTSWDVKKIRSGDLHIDDIAWTIKWMIDIFLSLSWTISVIFVIIWAYYLLFWSTKWDTSKWRETITMALTGFAISVLSWFIVKMIFDNFG